MIQSIRRLIATFASVSVWMTVATPAFATSVVYRAAVVTDVKLGKTLYRNAAVTLTFKTDTDGSRYVLLARFGWLLFLCLCRWGRERLQRGPLFQCGLSPG
jgi:hypothetical protein